MATTETVRLSKNSSAQWTSLNPILGPLEIGYEVDTKFFKIGDGTHPWNTLKHVVGMTENAMLIWLSDDVDNMIAMTSDGGIILRKSVFNGTAAYTAGKEQGGAAPTPPDEYNYTMMKVGQDVKNILASIVALSTRTTQLEARPLGDKINDLLTQATTTWSSSKVADAILLESIAIKADITANPNGAYDALVRLAQLLQDNDSLAVTISEELGRMVRFDSNQTLTLAQKAQARANMGAISADDLGDGSTLMTAYNDGLVLGAGSPFEQSEI